MRDKIERFLRGETWLHLVTMFLIQSIFLALLGQKTPLWVQYLPPIVLGLGKELYDKYHDKKFISLTDIIGTLLGGGLAIIIYNK